MKTVIFTLIALIAVLNPSMAADLRLTHKGDLKKLELLSEIDNWKNSARIDVTEMLQKMKSERGTMSLDMRLAKATSNVPAHSRTWWLAALHVLADTLATSLESARLQNEVASSLISDDLNQGTYRSAGRVVSGESLEETKELVTEVLALANFYTIQSVLPSKKVMWLSRLIGFVMPSAVMVSSFVAAVSHGHDSLGAVLGFGEIFLLIGHASAARDEVFFEPFVKTMSRSPEASQRREALLLFIDQLAFRLRVTLPDQMQESLKFGNPKVASNVLCSLLLTEHLPKLRIAKSAEPAVLESDLAEPEAVEPQRLYLKK